MLWKFKHLNNETYRCVLILVLMEDALEGLPIEDKEGHRMSS